MTLLVIFLGLATISIVYLRFLAVPNVWKWMHASDVGDEPIWRELKSCAMAVAAKHRVASPRLKVLPEFAPNALALRSRGRAEIGLTEGLVRALSAEELETAISLCLLQSTQPGRRRQAWIGLLLLPFAKRLNRAPFAFRVFLSPALSFALHVLGRPSGCYASDAAASAMHGPWQVAATLQKIAVMGRKIPLRRWNLALDSLFLIAPLALDDGLQSLVHGVFPGQPSLLDRRERILGGLKS